MSKKTHSVHKGSKTPLFHSDRTTRVEKLDKGYTMQIIMLLKPQNKIKINSANAMKREELKTRFIDKYGVSEKALSKLMDFTTKYDLTIDKYIKELGLIYLSGSVASLERAFKVELHTHEFKDEITRYKQSVIGHTDPHYLPKSLKKMVEGVIGLSHVPLMHHTSGDDTKVFSAARAFKPSWFAEHYYFPKDVQGKNQTIGIISGGGGITNEGMQEYFKQIGLKSEKKLKFISVDGSKNKPNKNFMVDFELATDCQIAQVAALDADIKVYSTHNTLKGFADALITIIEEEDDQPSIISYSWGAAESHYSPNEVKGVDRILKYTTLVEKVTILCAAGDKGSTNEFSSTSDTPLVVQYPASSPWVVSCGGTTIKIDDQDNIQESVWNSPFNLYDILLPNASGGGFSMYHKRPTYQKDFLSSTGENYPKKMRGIPDISAHADMSPAGIGYWINVNGQNWLSGGTSSVAPLLAAYVARLNELLGEDIGFLNPFLYRAADTDSLTPITGGTNAMPNGPQFWEAKDAWNPCTGLGILNGQKMAQLIKKMKL